VIAAAVAALILAALAFMRLGLTARYDDEGFYLAAKVFAFKITVMPRRKKPARVKTGKVREKATAKRPAKPAPRRKAGVADTVSAALKALGRLRRRLYVRRFELRCRAPGGDNPVQAAIALGALNAVCGAVTALANNALRIKEQDISVYTDFGVSEPKLYIRAEISIAVWEAIYTACALLPAFTRTDEKERKA
jgi:hypothetical protein